MVVSYYRREDTTGSHSQHLIEAQIIIVGARQPTYLKNLGCLSYYVVAVAVSLALSACPAR